MRHRLESFAYSVELHTFLVEVGHHNGCFFVEEKVISYYMFLAFVEGRALVDMVVVEVVTDRNVFVFDLLVFEEKDVVQVDIFPLFLDVQKFR